MEQLNIKEPLRKQTQIQWPRQWVTQYINFLQATPDREHLLMQTILIKTSLTGFIEQIHRNFILTLELKINTIPYSIVVWSRIGPISNSRKSIETVRVQELKASKMIEINLIDQSELNKQLHSLYSLHSQTS